MREIAEIIHKDELFLHKLFQNVSFSQLLLATLMFLKPHEIIPTCITDARACLLFHVTVTCILWFGQTTKFIRRERVSNGRRKRQ